MLLGKRGIYLTMELKAWREGNRNACLPLMVIKDRFGVFVCFVLKQAEIEIQRRLGSTNGGK